MPFDLPPVVEHQSHLVRHAGERDQERPFGQQLAFRRAHRHDAVLGGDPLCDMDVDRIGKVQSLGHMIAGRDLVHCAVDEGGHDQPAPPYFLDPRHRTVVESAGPVVVAPADAITDVQLDLLHCEDRHGIAVEVPG